MRVGALLGDVLRSLFRRPATEFYPYERHPTPERLRGLLAWDPARCTGCALCAKDCPSTALEAHMVDRAARRFRLVYHLDRCTYCGQCVESCRPASLDLVSDRWELAALGTGGFEVAREAILAGRAQADASA